MTTICVIFPQLLGTYGDAGNGLVLHQRARRRGFETTLVSVEPGDELPDAAIYLLGGGEDGPQRLAADLLRESSLSRRVRDGARVFAVCAGLQILGQTFCIEGNDEYAGLGLIDATTKRGVTRSVGEIMTESQGPRLVGFENHGGQTDLGVGVDSMGRVLVGRGNDGAVDGYHVARIWATYAHGPVLAMNPWLADLILEDLLGSKLEPLSSAADLLYDERCRALAS